MAVGCSDEFDPGGGDAGAGGAGGGTAGTGGGGAGGAGGAGGTGGGMAGSGGGGVVEPPDTTVDEERTLIAGQFIDSATGELVPGVSWRILEGGMLSSSPLGPDGAVMNQGTSADGFLDVRLSETVAVPLELFISAEREGYLASGTTVQVVTRGTNLGFAVSLVNLAMESEGIEVASSTDSVDKMGTTMEPITVDTGAEADPMTMGSAEIEVPAGTEITGDDGMPITGEVETQVVYFDGESDNAQQAFPGGLESVTVEGADGSMEAAEFVSGGFVSVTMTETSTGRSATGFANGGVTITSSVAGSTLNPNTGSQVASGDSIEVYSNNDGSNNWVEEGAVMIVNEPNEMTSLEATYTADHLTIFNFGYQTGKCGEQTLNINLPSMLSREVKARVRSGIVNSMGTCVITTERSTRFLDVPIAAGTTSASVQVTALSNSSRLCFRFDDAATNTTLNTTDITDNSGCGTLTFTAEFAADPPANGTLDISTDRVCSNNAATFGDLGNVSIRTKLSTADTFELAGETDDSGRLTANLPPGTYEVVARYAGSNTGAVDDVGECFIDAREGTAVDCRVATVSISSSNTTAIAFNFPFTDDATCGTGSLGGN